MSDYDIIVDVILCLPTDQKLSKWTFDDTPWNNALDFYYRKSAISSFYIDFEDMIRVTRANPNV